MQNEIKSLRSNIETSNDDHKVIVEQYQKNEEYYLHIIKEDPW